MLTETEGLITMQNLQRLGLSLLLMCAGCGGADESSAPEAQPEVDVAAASDEALTTEQVITACVDRCYRSAYIKSVLCSRDNVTAVTMCMTHNKQCAFQAVVSGTPCRPLDCKSSPVDCSFVWEDYVVCAIGCR